MDTQAKPSGTIVGIAVKTERKKPMTELVSAEAVVDSGLVGDLPVPTTRGMTLIDRKAWQATCSELGTDLPWTTRRANVLTEGVDLGPLIGRSIRIGEVELEIGGETDPCGLMDKLHNGLKDALEPECRGGVYGRVVKGGKISIGDAVVPIGG